MRKEIGVKGERKQRSEKKKTGEGIERERDKRDRGEKEEREG